MVYKSFKSAAIADIIRKETNVHFLNPQTNKIDLKMFTKHLHEKDEYADFELNNNEFEDSSCSDNQLLSYNYFSSEADIESLSSEKEKPAKKAKISRKTRPGTLSLVEYNGRIMKAKHRYSAWFLMYVDNPNLSDVTYLKDFRRRFRLPYYKYKELLFELKNHPMFARWWDDSVSASKIPTSPLELLLLGALRYLSRGWTFDDITESTGISISVLTYFFETFVNYGSHEFYKKYVTIPSTDDDWDFNSTEYKAAGFNGACASIDAVNIVCEKICYAQRQQYLGYKQSLTARTFNVSINHR